MQLKPANVIFDLLRTYPDRGTSARAIMATDVLTQGVHDEKTPDLSGTRPDGADAVQLDRSPSGPQPPR